MAQITDKHLLLSNVKFHDGDVCIVWVCVCVFMTEDILSVLSGVHFINENYDFCFCWQHETNTSALQN